jgi:MFS family permease
MSDRLFTARFLAICAYSFTVFVSLFQLLPAAPYRVLNLGGTTAAAGLFLGLLTYASALSAPLTGPLGDRLGHRRVLMLVSLVVSAFTASYAFMTGYRTMLVAVVFHGMFWSALLSASGAYVAAVIPESRRAEGLGYWGLASVVSIAVAPAIGFWVYQAGWRALCLEITALNLVMTAIAWRLPPDATMRAARAARPSDEARRHHVEWRVLALAITLSLVSFGYGSLTSFSALYADQLHVSPRSLYLTAMACAILAGRLTLGRSIDRIGHRRVLLASLAAPALALLLLALAGGRTMLLASACVFGAGFGLLYPAFTALAIGHVSPLRRGAAFGAILAAFDSGIGTGSTVMGWLIEAWSYRAAYVAAAALAALSVPYFLTAERRLGFAGPIDKQT